MLAARTSPRRFYIDIGSDRGFPFFALNWPFTLIVIMPVNHALEAADPGNAPAESRRLLQRWGALHAVRTALGLVATFVFLWASMR